MIVNITSKEIEAVMDILRNTYLVPDAAQRAMQKMEAALDAEEVAESKQFGKEVAELAKRIERLERAKQYDREVERAWRGE